MQTLLFRFFKEIGADYSLKNFEFAVLETFGSGTNDQTIINQENWWKETLHTRQELNKKMICHTTQSSCVKVTEKRLNFQHLLRLPMGTISLFSDMRMLRTKSPLLRLKKERTTVFLIRTRSCPYSKANRDLSANAMTFFGPSDNF